MVDQGVREAERSRALGLLHQHGGGDRLFEHVEQLVLSLLDNLCQDVHVEVTSDHRRRGERAPRALAEPIDAPADHLAHALRKPELGDVALEPPPAARSPHERLGLDQVTEHLRDEERIAVCLRGDLAREPESELVHLVAGRRLHDRDDVALRKPGQGDPLDPGLTPQVREGVGERMPVRELAVAVSAEDEETLRPGVRDDVLEERECWPVGPVKVVQEQDNRPVARRLREQPAGA